MTNTYKASELFNKEELEFVKWVIETFNGMVTKVEDLY